MGSLRAAVIRGRYTVSKKSLVNKGNYIIIKGYIYIYIAEPLLDTRTRPGVARAAAPRHTMRTHPSTDQHCSPFTVLDTLLIHCGRTGRATANSRPQDWGDERNLVVVADVGQQVGVWMIQ